MNNENNGNNMEMPAVAGNGNNQPNVEPSAAERINQSNNVLPGQNQVPNMQQPMNNGMMQNNQMNPGMQQPMNNMNMGQGMQQPMGNGMQQPMGNSQGGGLNNIVNTIKGLDPKILIAGCAGVVVVFLLAIVLIGGSMGSNGVVKRYSNYYVKGDYKKIVKLYQEDYVDYIEKYSKDDYEDMMKEVFKDRKDDDIKYKGYKVLDKNKLDKEQLDDLRDELEDDYDIEEKDVRGAVQYLVKYKIDNDGHPNVGYESVTAVKIKGKWYIFNSNYYNIK